MTARTVYGLGPAMAAVIHVSVPRPFRGTRAVVVVHVVALAAGEALTVWDDVSVTSVPRTLTAVAVEGDPALAIDAARDALRHGLTTPDQDLRGTDRPPGRGSPP